MNWLATCHGLWFTPAHLLALIVPPRFDFTLTTPPRTPMTKPTIHMNGTSAKDLLEQYRTAMEALSAAGDALAKCGPNGRDYYPQGPDAIGTAMDEHRSRRLRLEAIYDEITELAIHCSDHA